MTADRVSFLLLFLGLFFYLRTVLKYASKFSFNWTYGYEINGVSNVIFASGPGIGLSCFF